MLIVTNTLTIVHRKNKQRLVAILNPISCKVSRCFPVLHLPLFDPCVYLCAGIEIHYFPAILNTVMACGGQQALYTYQEVLATILHRSDGVFHEQLAANKNQDNFVPLAW